MKQHTRESSNFRSGHSGLAWVTATMAFCASLLLLLALLFVLSVAAQASRAAGSSVAKASTFATPQEAAGALIDAAERYDVAALEQILGPDSRDIIYTGET